MGKRNKKKNKLPVLPKGASRGTRNEKILMKFFGSRIKDPNRLTANQIRGLWAKDIESRLAERQNKK